VAIRRDDEMGALANAFNDMAARIEAQFDALEGLAVVDRDILEGEPIEGVIGHVLGQLRQLYPGARVTVSWKEGDAGLRVARLLDDAAPGAPAMTECLVLNAEQAARYASLERDELRGVEVSSAVLAPDAEPWLQGALRPGASRLVLLPLRVRDHTQAIVTLALPRALASAQLHPACEFRDRLAVAFAARAREHELVHRAIHDSLTGLANRFGLLGHLDNLLGTGEVPRQAAVLFLDLDHFKDVNDSRGHEAGDELLRLASLRLQAVVPADAFVARPGGDEFVVVLTGGDQAQACELAASAIASLARPFVQDGGEYALGASVGIALAPQHGHTREELLRCADVALYAAKAAGRGRHQLFTPVLDHAAQVRVQLQIELPRALERSEFIVQYQPRVRSHDGIIVSAEALVRWQHPERGLIMPGAFIEHAESSGLIEGIGQWVLDTACAQAAAWRAQGVGIERVSVNVSARQFASGKLLGQVRAAMERHALPAHALELEVTESLLIDRPNDVSAVLAELRRWGVSIALDDFGTGYSSMSILRRLPIDVMKVDRAFVVDLGVDPGAMAMVRTIVTLARSLGMLVVAEGVETASQASLLRSLGCEQFQGFLYGKPMAAEQFTLFPGLPMRPATRASSTGDDRAYPRHRTDAGDEPGAANPEPATRTPVA
jgi:diguanylate cyclase (GGDEF)-like protein